MIRDRNRVLRGGVKSAPGVSHVLSYMVGLARCRNQASARRGQSGARPELVRAAGGRVLCR